MAGASAPGRLTNSKCGGGRRDWHPLDLEGVAEALQSTRTRTLRRDCLESRDRAYRWCVRKAHAEGRQFRATLRQAAAGLGYPMTGDKRKDFNSFAKSVRRCLDDLQAAGLIQWGGVKWSNGQWRCIEVCMPDQMTTTHDNGGYVNSGEEAGALNSRLRSPIPALRPTEGSPGA